MSMTVAQLTELLDNYGDHLPVYYEASNGAVFEVEAIDSSDSLVNNGAPFVAIHRAERVK